MDVRYINPFLTSTTHVFETMLSIPLTRGNPFIKGGEHPEHEVSGIIGLSGLVRGSVVLSLRKDTALAVSGALLGETPSDINADVTDAIGELTNMIAGNAKAQLERFKMSVGLPNVITGNGHAIDFPKAATPICIPFESEFGPVVVEVGLHGSGMTTPNSSAGVAQREPAMAGA